MDKTILVNDDKRDGLNLVKALEQAGIPVAGAFWYELPDTGRWRLFIVTPWVDSLGPLATYHRINDVLRAPSSEFNIGLDDVTAAGTEHTIVRQLASRFTAQPGARPSDLPIDRLGGLDVGDAYVYRLHVPAKTRR